MNALRAKKEDLMKEVYTILTATLGAPPPVNKKFVFDYYDKDGKPGRWEGTPVEFYKVCVLKIWSVFSALWIEGAAECRLRKVSSLGFILPHQ